MFNLAPSWAVTLCIVSIAAHGTTSEPERVAGGTQDRRQVAGDRIQLTLDPSEAERVLGILALRSQGAAIHDDEWRQLFLTAPYRRLKERESAIGKMLGNVAPALTDDDFKWFVLSDDLLSRAAALSSALTRWRSADLEQNGARVLDYLPAEATLRAKVYPVIKPRSNSFVWDTATDPTIFVSLDPDMTREKFENTVMHELHHIGLASVGPVYEKKIAGLPEAARVAAGWMGAFGEGMAMLAAAGSPDVDPHAASASSERARWQQDLARFNLDLQTVDQFFLDILNAAFTSSQAREEKGRSFYGVQGPWYTVGYKMSVIVETRFGRPALIGTMHDPRCLLDLYNKAARELKAAGEPGLPLWSEDIFSALRADTCPVP